MEYEKLRQRVLEENDLVEESTVFQRNDEEVSYADRHALWYAGHKYDPYALDRTTVKLGVKVGLDLLRHWSSQRKSITSLHVSEPFLCIVEEWLLGRENSAPPSVNICLAKTEAAFKPVPFEGTQRDLILDSDVDLSDTTVVFVEGYDDPDEEERLGAWLIRIDDRNLESSSVDGGTTDD